MVRVKFDLARVNDLLGELDTTVARLEALDVELTDEMSRQEENRERAVINRDLLRAKDLATAVAGELAMTYWEHRGTDDPRKEG